MHVIKKLLLGLLCIGALGAAYAIGTVIIHEYRRAQQPPLLKSTASYGPQPLSYWRYEPVREELFSSLDATLFTAVSDNDIPAARDALNKGANVNQLVFHDQPHHGKSPLFFAIQRNNLKMAELLIQAGAEVNELADTSGIADDIHDHPNDDVRNNPLLVYAIIMNNPDMVRLLIKHGADVNKADFITKKWTPLAVARYNKRDEIVKILLAAGAK